MDDSNGTNEHIEDVVEVNDPAEPSQKKTKLTSDVWLYFKKISRAKDGIERAECKGCKKPFKVGSTPGRKGKNYGISHLHRHKYQCPMLKVHDLGQMFLNQEGKMQSRKIDQWTHRSILAEAVIKHNLPYSFVEYDRIKSWVNYISPDVKMPSRNICVADVKKVYVREKEKLKQILAKIPNKVCLTSDCWTSSNSEGYICSTAQFVDKNWRLVCKILNFCRMYPPHTGVELATAIYDCLKEWGIDKKVFSITLDNATANDSLQNILKGHLRLQKSLLCDGEFFHVRCSAHILNLIVQEGLKAASDSLFSIRESVKYVKGSNGRKQKFEQCVKEVGIETNLGLRLDVSTRWNSTYMMLDSALQYEKAFASLHLIDRNYTYCPTLNQWRRAEKIFQFLEPFYETTNLISGSSYPTSNLYFMQVWRIECMLNENLNNEDELDSVSAQEKIEHVKNKLYKLYDHYGNKQNIASASSSTLTTPSEERSKSKGTGFKIFDEFKAFENVSASNDGKSELDIYLEEPKLDFEKFREMDVIMYWKNHSGKYPDLSVMARDVLSIPITTVASESAFSIGGRVLTKYRSCIHHENVQTLVATRNWLHGFTQTQSDKDDNVKATLSEADLDMSDNVMVLDML
ncbi:PREDICTED: zinc finger BED domain-containing protein RICESLEEPER 2-like [Nicotiana attenuata]|uniref:zinc finger BED domain-containing protein RICESLEEPER 2-like n=1 Tax=Nicotiana attenuata TaxID=49451 RepID=UPI00090538E5|nr:PREDICTED: zinc finger BED domain-containing protein RICESLEEPER 2-like [Nicotiana attenuata]